MSSEIVQVLTQYQIDQHTSHLSTSEIHMSRDTIVENGYGKKVGKILRVIKRSHDLYAEVKIEKKYEQDFPNGIAVSTVTVDSSGKVIRIIVIRALSL